MVMNVINHLEINQVLTSNNAVGIDIQLLFKKRTASRTDEYLSWTGLVVF